jgi:hypothetical protein
VIPTRTLSFQTVPCEGKLTTASKNLPRPPIVGKIKLRCRPEMIWLDPE